MEESKSYNTGEKRPFKSRAQMLEECRTLRTITRAAGVLLIINDYPDIAQLVDADGVHVGQDDFPVAEVRKLIGENKLIGLSTHNPEQAEAAIVAGADYIGVGPHLQHPDQRRCVCTGGPGVPGSCGQALSPPLCRHRRDQGTQSGGRS